MNRLKHETSPYLLQHADNPVHWYAWGEEAFAAAQAQDKPILLSVGYSACHWCHVMAHESFEDEETAEIMNRLYINIKVDREERPDVDDIYMQAVQAMTRSGGWPMTVFLLPDGRPFYGGTYYPKEPAYGRPSFQQILDGVYDAFANRRDQVEEAATNLREALGRDLLGIGGDEKALNADLLNAAYKGILRGFDPEWGGFSGAPKFPQPMNLDFLLRAYVRTKDVQILDALTFTLRKMATGGIYDQIGGGFARYSVDRYWLVPHFEKMLYDNAQLSRVYLRAWQVTADAFFRPIAEEIYDYVLREMTSPEGSFYSATDADSEGEEGKFFVWSKSELEALLGEDAPAAIEYWGVSTRGNFEGHNILHVPNDEQLVAERLGITVDELRAVIVRSKDTLYAHRSQRVHPLLDDKQLASWNGMMLASLAEAARLLNRDDYRTAAVRCGEFVLREFITPDGRITRTHKNGESRINGVLEDYANLIDALLELYQLTFDMRWFTAARQLADTTLTHFAAEDGGFYDTSDDHEALIVRPRNVQDNATPSGNSMLAKGLLRLAAYTGDARYDAAARGGLRLLTEAMRQYPGGFGEALNAADMLVNGIAEVALVGSLEDEATRDLLRGASHPYRPNVVIALSESNVEGEAEIPLLSYRTLRGGRPTAYVCRNFVCKLPVNTAEEMRALLDEQAVQH